MNPQAVTSLDKLRDTVKTLMSQCIQKFGGPENYLRQRYGTRAAKQEWLNYLGEIQNVNGIHEYNTSVDLAISNQNQLSQAGGFTILFVPNMFDSLFLNVNAGCNSFCFC